MYYNFYKHFSISLFGIVLGAPRMEAFQGPLSLYRTLIWRNLSLLNLRLYIVNLWKAGGSPNVLFCRGDHY